MNTLIIEDEPRAARRLQQLIKQVSPEAEVVGLFDSVRETLDFIDTKPEIDLIFADIQLSDGLSFEIFEKTNVPCPVIFTTAYDQYAIEAFNANGIDYLLEPIREDRLRQAIRKLENLRSGAQDYRKLLTIVEQLKNPTTSYKIRFIVKVGEKIKLFYSGDKATFMVTDENRNYIVDYTLEQLTGILNPAHFFRINRKYIVALKSCKEIYSWSNSRLKWKLKGLIITN